MSLQAEAGTVSSRADPLQQRVDADFAAVQEWVRGRSSEEGGALAFPEGKKQLLEALPAHKSDEQGDAIGLTRDSDPIEGRLWVQ